MIVPLTSVKDLLKSIHHFASCFYRERGQLFDSSKDYRGKKKERKQSQGNVHIIAATTREHQNTSSECEHSETEDESTEEVEDQGQVMDMQDSEGEALKGKADTYKKDMYKAFDGSALMAIGLWSFLPSEVDSIYCRHCAAGICGTYALIRRLYF